LDLASRPKYIERQVVAAIEVGAIGCERVDLARLVRPTDEPASAPARGAAAHDHDVAVAACPLALDAHESIDEVEDQVVAPALSDGRIDVDVQIQRRPGDRKLGDRAFPIGRKPHALDRSRALGWAVSALDSRL
jgi:hypothetical protein